MRISDWSSDVCSSDLVQALRGLSATIRYGRLTGLVGPDGASKTTLMRIMTGLLVPNAGRVTLAGRSEERRVGKECVSPCSSRWSPEHYKKNKPNNRESKTYR